MSFRGGWATVRLTVPSLTEMRKGLRALRRELELTLDALSDQSGIDRAAIHRIENVDKYPDYEPGLDTFRRMVEGLGLTLQDFFARFPAARQSESGTFRQSTPDIAGNRASVDRVIRLLGMMSDEGQREAAGVLATLARAFPRGPLRESVEQGARKRAAATRKARGTRRGA